MASLTDSVKKLILACELKDNGSPTLLGDGHVDTAGWNHVTWTLFLGAIDITVDFKIQESDDAVTWADIAGKALSQVAATGDNKVYVIEVPKTPTTLLRKRYQKPVCVVGDGAVGAQLCIEAELSSYTGAAADVASVDLGQRV